MLLLLKRKQDCEFLSCRSIRFLLFQIIQANESLMTTLQKKRINKRIFGAPQIRYLSQLDKLTNVAIFFVMFSEPTPKIS